MELERIIAYDAEQDESLVQIASRIRPLPEDVEPSPEFLRRMRLRLLELPQQEVSRQQQAA